jgi:hypothetical protein
MSAPSAKPAGKAPATLSTSQMVQLMRLETERATQHNYPISSLRSGWRASIVEDRTCAGA